MNVNLSILKYRVLVSRLKYLINTKLLKLLRPNLLKFIKVTSI